MKKIFIVFLVLFLFYGCLEKPNIIEHIHKFIILNTTNETEIFNNTTIKEIKEKEGPYDKYLRQIKTDGLDFIFPLLKDCNNYECKIMKIYDYVQKIDYVSDPKGEEIIKEPLETIEQGGDCEDKAILAAALLLKIKAHPMLVFTKDHAYTLACGINLTKMREAIIEERKDEIKEKLKKNEKINIHLRPYEMYLINITTNGYYQIGYLKAIATENNLSYYYNATSPIRLYIVYDSNDVQKLVLGNEPKKLPCDQGHDALTWKGKCNLKNGIVVLYNNNDKNVDINLEINDSYSFKTEFIKELDYYLINNSKCVVLDTTLTNGYPGYEIAKDKEVAIDVLTNISYPLK